MQKLLVTAAVLLVCGYGAHGQIVSDGFTFERSAVREVTRSNSEAPERNATVGREGARPSSQLEHGSSDTVSAAFDNPADSNRFELNTLRDRILTALNKVHSPTRHKDLWPLDKRDWFTLAIASFSIFIAAGGGIGGGGVLVPLYASLLGKIVAISTCICCPVLTIHNGMSRRCLCYQIQYT